MKKKSLKNLPLNKIVISNLKINDDIVTAVSETTMILFTLLSFDLTK